MTRLGFGLLFMFLLTACGAGQESGSPAAATPTHIPVPTYTPTLPASASPVMAVDTPTVAPAAPSATADETPTAVALVLPTATAAPEAQRASTVDTATAGEPRLTVTEDAVNVRSGPGTDYPLAGLAVRAASYPITGRNEAGDWWQVCCIDGEPGWLFGALVTVENADAVAVAAAGAPPPVAASPVAIETPAVADAPATPSAAVEAPPAAEAPPAVEAPPADNGGTAGNFDPNAQYQIVHYRVLGFDDNNGGIFNKGGQQLIFLTVLDQNGAPVDGAVVKDAVGDKLDVVTGSKGPGKAEIKMDWDPYKPYVASDPAGPVTSQVSNQMNNPHPHLPDVIGKLGPLDNEYAVCPTPEVNCTPPFFTVHFSYEVTFQRVR